MKNLAFYLLPSLLFIACSSSNKKSDASREFMKKNPVVTIETSGDLYFEEGGENVQLDVFGNCAPGQSTVYVVIDQKKYVSDCQKGRYRYSLNLPPNFFKQSARDKRSPSSQYALKEVIAFHEGRRDLKATSYILIDKNRKEIKSVINKQVRFERIPTGEFEPVTQYNSFGSCTRDAIVTIDISSPDRFGHMVSKYDEKKKCDGPQGYYFLTQIHGVPSKGTQFKIYEDRPSKASGRQPASQSKQKYKNLFNWKVPIN